MAGRGVSETSRKICHLASGCPLSPPQRLGKVIIACERPRVVFGLGVDLPVAWGIEG